MVHVTQENVAIVDIDLLIHEVLRASEKRDAFAYVISPFVADFPLAASWLSFVSNIIDVSDIDSYVDLIGLLRHHGVEVRLVTRSPKDLAATTISRKFIEKQARTLSQLAEIGCEIRTNASLHAKATITTRGVLSGSFNLTQSGRAFNLEAGFYFPNTKGTEKREYEDKLRWAEKVFEESAPLTESTLVEWR
jgi:phosphatidylserine/phosphatidylglycerophosphate/cardiolipin synthase-like enzyme